MSSAGWARSVKLTGLVGVVALVVSTSVIRGRRPAVRIATAALGVVGAGYLLAGASAILTPMRTAGAAYSSASVWRVLPKLGFETPSTHVAIALLAVPCVFVILAYSKDRSACVTAGLTTLTLGAAYMLPGYVGWALPSAALDDSRRVSRIAATEGVVLVAWYEVFRHPMGGPIGDQVLHAAKFGAPFVTLALLLFLLVDGARESRRIALELRPPVARPDRGHDLVRRSGLVA